VSYFHSLVKTVFRCTYAETGAPLSIVQAQVESQWLVPTESHPALAGADAHWNCFVGLHGAAAAAVARVRRVAASIVKVARCC
jgi:hypothetical protein